MRIAILGALVILFSLPLRAQGQTHGTMGGGSPNAGYSGGGGAGAGGFSGATSMFHTPATHFEFGYAHGAESDFNPSSFMEYDEAVKLGRSIVEAKPKSLGEIAAEYRAKKKQPAS